VSRLRRREREHRRRSIELLVAIVVAAGGIAYGTTQTDLTAIAGGSPSPSVTHRAPPALLVLSVTGAPKPLVAVIGTGGSPPAAMGVPQGLSIEVPGAGALTTNGVAALPGPALQVAVSNLVGAWVQHYAVTDLTQLATMVNRIGTMTLVLPDAVTLGAVVLGPGPVRMTGAQVAAFIGAPGVDTFTRWEILLTGLLTAPPKFQRGDLTATDDLAGVQATLDRAKDAQIETLPVQLATASIRVPKYPALDELMRERFGVTRAPVPVIVQNGVGTPGIGEAVARLLIPKGFRVTLSQNAVTFDQTVTQIEALGDASLAEARRARAALGVGRVRVSPVASGIGDVQIVVGKDFTA
jgi:hypothetical protein